MPQRKKFFIVVLVFLCVAAAFTIFTIIITSSFNRDGSDQQDGNDSSMDDDESSEDGELIFLRQRLSLIDFYESTGGSNTWKINDGWKDSKDKILSGEDDNYCLWHGVTCGLLSNVGGNAPKRNNGVDNYRRKQQEEETKRIPVVVKLELAGNNLSSDAFDAIMLQNITSLVELDISSNDQLYGNIEQISHILFQIPTLQRVDLRFNPNLYGNVKSDICSALEGRKQDLFQVDCEVECACCSNQMAACQCFDDPPDYKDDNGNGCSWCVLYVWFTFISFPQHILINVSLHFKHIQVR